MDYKNHCVGKVTACLSERRTTGMIELAKEIVASVDCLRKSVFWSPDRSAAVKKVR